MMEKRKFNKPHLDLDAQIARLESGGMTIADKNRAKRVLSQVSYYRLGFYWYDFKDKDNAQKFISGADFDHIVSLYEFDRQLRLLIWKAIDRIEIFARVQWAHNMSAFYKSHAHCIKRIHEPRKWQRNLNDLRESVRDSEQPFIANFMRKYSDDIPPIWAVAEIITFGSLARWYGCLKVQHVQRELSRAFNVPYPVLKSWLYHLNGIRNTCAHHERLWNQNFGKNQMQHPERLLRYKVNNNRIYNTLLVISDLMRTVDPDAGWHRQLISLLDDFSSVPKSAMGFPEDWENLPIWK